MEVAPTANSDAHPATDEPPLPDTPSSPQRRRHIRYASPPAHSSSNPQTPFVTQQPSQSRSPPPVQQNMDSVQPSATTPANDVTPNPSQPQLGQPTPAGQNHDRMETDEDSDDTRTESGRNTPEQSESTADTAPPPAAVDGEPMDTTPDPLPVTAVPATIQPPPPVSNESNTLNNILRIGMTASISIGTNGVPTLLDAPTFSLNANGIDQQNGDVRVTIPTGALETLRTTGQPPPPQREDSVESRRRERREEREREREEDDSSDSSDDDEENPYWASFKEDTSTPDERELRVIEESEKTMPVATDHEHWEKTTFESLDDPEYIPQDVGRITWTVKGVHGTPEKPNKERIMRSPSVRIGDYYWNIKYYPRGNDGTEQVSVYLECSPKSYEELEAEESDKDKAIEDGASHAEERPAESATGDTPMNGASVEGSQTLPDATSTADQPPAPTQTTQAQPAETASDGEKPWRVAAQVCCVMYNPNEPRVYAHQKSVHSYYNDNPDWGWTRFYGPWDDLHQRKRYQRQAMLRDDTLAFTVYIRTVKDDTKALWWHPPKDKPSWDSLEMAGARAFKCIRPEQSSAVVSALSAWLHLSPILSMIRKVNVPDCFTEPDKRPRPLFEELKALLEETGEYSDKSKDLSLSLISTLMEVNSFDGIRKMDVVALWEHLRRLLTFEGSSALSVEEACNTEIEAFKDILLLKQPDLFNLDPQSRKYQPEARDVPAVSPTYEPTSVQEVVDLASQHPEKAFRVWECFPLQRQDPARHPQVLQIELHRQHFDQTDRKWMKLGHRIGLDEQLDFSGASYTLYGIIVHSGSLESQEFYSVIRPGGPKTRWLKYAGESSPRKVSVLTTKQAISNHEGTGPPVLEKKNSEKKKENAAVAYIAMYVLTDSISSVLEMPFDRKILDARKTQAASEIQISPAADGEITSTTTPEKPPSQVPVYFYSGDAFNGNDELETFDPWSKRIQKEAQDVCQILLSETVRVRDIKQLLDHFLEESSDVGANKRIKVWLLDSRKPCLGSSPAFYFFERHADEALEVVPQFSEGCRFWLGGQDVVAIRQVLQQLKSCDPMKVIDELKKAEAAAKDAQNMPPPAQTNGDNAAASEAQTTATPETDANANAAESTNTSTTQAEGQDTAIAEAPAETDTSAAANNETADQTGEAPTPQTTSNPTEDPSSQATIVEESNTTEEARSEDRPDVVMSDAQESENQPPPPQPTASEPQNSSNPAPEERQILCFLKVFDWEKQSLSSTASFSAPLTSTVTSEIKKALGVEQKQSSDDTTNEADMPESEQDQWDVYHERFQFSKSYDLVTSSMAFDNFALSTEFLPNDVQIIVPTDGACFIAQRRPNAEQITALEAAGKPTTVPQYIQHLLAQTYNPTNSLPQRTTSYLGSNYFSGSQSYSRPHGQGTLVTMTGDTYTGPFTSGEKSGQAGKMVFANKDIYEGAWEHDEPSGEGQMTYAKTGNVYKGGWKRGKRHGKGTMQFEVADEEMKLCQVCYEEEMDSLFYACGHVCACEGCARQVEACPVCRERVRGVVKVRWTV